VHWWIDTRDKPGLLFALLRHFEGDSHVSFEGHLQQLALAELPGASTSETLILRRQTVDCATLLSQRAIESVWRIADRSGDRD